MMKRRRLLGGILLPMALIARPALAGGLLQSAGLRGSLDATGHVVMPEGTEGSSRRFQRVLQEAAARGRPVFLPPGTYRVSGLELPENTEINGVPGRSRIEYDGEGRLFSATGLKRLRLSGLVIDGANRWLGEDAPGLVHCIGVERVEIEGCGILGSSRSAVHLEGCGGEIRENRISGAADAGIYAVESRSLALRDNEVASCGNGGILIHRYKPGEDGSIVSGNRVSNILARDGGTGQNGNGINIFRAANVIVANNQVEDCAFSAIRANSASGIQISANQCLRSGETAIYSEFAFEGAVVSANLVDGAANGISIVNFNEGGRLSSVTGNVVRNLVATGPYPPADAGFGIGIAAEADTVISGNAIDKAGKWGLLIGWGPYLRNVVASGNMVRGAQVGCAVTVADGAGSALISSNLFADTSLGAVCGFRWNERVPGDFAADAAALAPAHLTIEGNRAA